MRAQHGRECRALENHQQLLAGGVEAAEEGVKVRLWRAQEAKADGGDRNSSSMKLGTHLGGMLRTHLKRIAESTSGEDAESSPREMLRARLGRMPT